MYSFTCPAPAPDPDPDPVSVPVPVPDLVPDFWIFHMPHETLNLLHVSRCEMLHFVTSYMKQNKIRKQTLESAQNRLENIFKS